MRLSLVRRLTPFGAVYVLAAYVVYLTICGVPIMRPSPDIRDVPPSPQPPVQANCSLEFDESVTVRIRLPSPDAPLQTNYSDEPTRILYLTQTEECLPDHLKSALRNSSACRCDVVVLSYKKACNDISLPHVEYLFNKSTTWTTGRNLLFHSKIHNRSEGYLYFIMMDDDIEPRWTKTAKGRNTNPWRSFEEFIMRVQPAVAALDLREKFLNAKLELRKLNNCSTELEYIPTVGYDAAFNAFHYKAIEHLLPYWDRMESCSWFSSQVYNIVWSEITFRGQVVICTDLLALNSLHRKYPRNYWIYKDLPPILRSITQRVPVNCQNASVLQEWRAKGIPHGWSTSATYCLPPPQPNQTIVHVPFKNFIC